ncbi:MAG: hypothetical protein R3C53_27755 [Pirellulaceae bacterium]
MCTHYLAIDLILMGTTTEGGFATTGVSDLSESYALQAEGLLPIASRASRDHYGPVPGTSSFMDPSSAYLDESF